MIITSTQINTHTFFEPREHSTACQCPGCCKKDAALNTAVSDTNENTPADNDTIGDKNTKDDTKLSSSEQQELLKLKQRDSEVRSHEAAHIAAGGAAVSGAASFTYQKGPDGQLYAVGGEVPISSSGGNTPEEKIAIAKQIQAGALAPANPSPQDIKVAASAAVMEAQARRELSFEASEALKQKAVDTYNVNQSYAYENKSNIAVQA